MLAYYNLDVSEALFQLFPDIAFSKDRYISSQTGNLFNCFATFLCSPFFCLYYFLLILLITLVGSKRSKG